MKQFNVTTTVSQDLICGLLASAFESGGVNYWAKILWDESKAPTNEDDVPQEFRNYAHLSHCWGDGKIVIVELDEYHSNEDTATRHVLNEETIQQGLNLMSEHYISHFADLCRENYDIFTADVFVQCCLFQDDLKKTGEVRYG